MRNNNLPLVYIKITIHVCFYIVIQCCLSKFSVFYQYTIKFSFKITCLLYSCSPQSISLQQASTFSETLDFWCICSTTDAESTSCIIDFVVLSVLQSLDFIYLVQRSYSWFIVLNKSLLQLLCQCQEQVKSISYKIKHTIALDLNLK